MTLQRRAAAATAAALALVALAGCANQMVRDLEGVPIKDPDKLEAYSNVDKFPNVVRVCIDGVAFATTTREQGNTAIFRVPEWDASFCGSVR